MITNNIVDLIGNTPLIKLKYPSEITNVKFMAKLSFLILEDPSKIEQH